MPQLQWVGHMSTASVYGDQDVIDASTVPRPSTASERMRMLIEREWAELDLPEASGPVHIFRPAHVYGAWRGPQQWLRAGRATAIEKPGFVASRIHVEDVARAVVAAMKGGDGGGQAPIGAGGAPSVGATAEGCPVEGAGCSVFLLADDEPAAPADVLRYAASLYGCAPPPSVDYDLLAPSLSAASKAFWRTPVRVSASDALASLGVRLAYPSYREGLSAVRAAEGSAGAKVPPQQMPPPEAKPAKPAATPRAKPTKPAVAQAAPAAAPSAPAPATAAAAPLGATAESMPPPSTAHATAAAGAPPSPPPTGAQEDLMRAFQDASPEEKEAFLKRLLDGGGAAAGAAPATAPAAVPAVGVSAHEALQLVLELRASGLKKKKVTELKELLRALALPVSGRKDDLVERLVGRADAEQGEQAARIGLASQAAAAAVGGTTAAVRREELEDDLDDDIPF